MIARLRARRALTELRAREPAFTVNEARELLVRRERIELADELPELLVERTEGWPDRRLDPTAVIPIG